MKIRHWRLPVLLLSLLFVAALLLTLHNLTALLPYAAWGNAWLTPDINNISEMLFHYSALPRLVISLLVGSGLGLAGVLFQQVLRNPLAEPSTLGVAAGAQLGVTVATLWTLPLVLQPLAALAGAGIVALLVFGAAWGKRLSPVTLILAGLVMSMYCGAVNQLLAIFNHDALQNMFLWSTGSLNQTDWRGVSDLWPRLAGAVIVVALMLRPLTLIGLDDGVARNLGLALSTVRLVTLTLAVVISALLVNAVGIIGFIGLFAPLLAKMLGARRLLPRIALAAMIGALILWFSDQLIVWLATVWREMSTGTVTALIGTPLLLWLLPRLRTQTEPSMSQGDHVPRERQHAIVWVLLGLGLLLLLLAIALIFGRDADAWHWASGSMLADLWQWRWPRVMAAMSAGMMLAVAGCIIQRLTGNGMASPEVLGISSGAAFGVVIMMLLVPGDTSGWWLPAGSLGAAITLFIIIITGSRGGFSPQRMLLAGMALSTAFTMLMMLLLASGDPRMATLLTWISGSTYGVNGHQALWTLVIMAVLLLLTPLCQRWLQILPLGGATARGVGVALMPARMALLLLAATLTAAATQTVGPLSFVGLMAPHITRMLGFRRALPQLVIAALLGGALMVLADWCGRMLLFPDQIPAGLLATFIGAPYFVLLLRRQEK